MKKEPATSYERVKKSNAALVQRGGRRAPDGYLQPDEAQALADLLSADYADTPIAVVRAAIMDAHRKISRKS